MFKSTKQLRENENIVLLSGDKDTSMTIMNKTDYQNKVQKMINDGISVGKYVHTEDTIIKDLSSFQSFLLCHFNDHPQYKDMRPSNNQPARLFATAKTHKFHNIKDANLKELKLRPIIDQTATCYYHASKVIANYLKPLAENDYVINDTQRFPSMLNDLPPLNEEEEKEVSYDVESLFTSVPVKDTIAFICSEIYEKKKLKPICSRIIFRKLLLKLTTECIFTANNKLYKQTDGVSMGGPLSVTFTGCFMNNMEQQIVVLRNPLFYKRFVDDTYRRRKKGVTDEMFTAMNTFHPNIKLTIEQNPTQFLDTQINRSNGTTSFSVVNKDTKLPFHWSSKVPIQYKCSVIKGELSRASRIATSFEIEVKRITKKYQNAGYPKRFIEKQIESFTGIKEEPIIPIWLFEEKTETRQKVFIKIPYCPKNESHIRKVIAKLNEFTNNKLQIVYTWKRTKLRSLFRLKDKITHVSNVIYKGECSCGDTYIGETKRNAVIRWKELNSNNQKSEPSKHLVQNPDHEFNWSILARSTTR